MSDRDAFLANIREHPDDNTARLVYADWLQDQGEDDRAEFIRVQVELAQGEFDAPNRAQLRRRERDLWLAHGSEWLSELARLEGVIWEGFRRGLPGRITVLRWDVSLAEILRIAAVSEINSSSDDRAHDPIQFFRGTESRAIRHIELPSGGWTDADVTQLAELESLSGLVSLNFRHNPIGAEAARAIAESTSLAGLAALSLSQNSPHSYLPTEGALSLIRAEKLASLRLLDISGCLLGDEGARILAGEPGLGRLTGLGLSYCQIDADGIQALAESPHLDAIQALDLTFNTGVDASLALIERLPKLVALDLGNHSVRAVDLDRLFTRARQGRLRYLRLAGDNLEDLQEIDDPEKLALDGLIELDLQDTQLGDGGIRTLARVSGLSGIHRLSIGGNDVGDTGMTALMRADLSSLGLLIACSNRISVTGVRALAESPSVTQLTHLDLSNNLLDDEAAEVLAASEHLERLTVLDLAQTQITERGVRTLLDSPKLPGLRRVNLVERESERLGMALGPRYLLEWEI